nr:lipopolysaccharide assembly protein LapB [Marichromatium bheemlicum]
MFLLLPIAAASGWWLARRDPAPSGAARRTASPSFLRGLNYLLDEQPDKALDLFIALAEVDDETVETHLALGSLFRRRGEVDRAIRIHQNLMARPSLDAEQRGYALLELGQDYMSAGLLDRAELLFQELAGLGLHRQRALAGLREIYQQERDWERCLEVAKQLRPGGEAVLDAEIAHYHCELAEEARRQGDCARARTQLARAREIDPACVRACILEGRAALEDGEPEQALALFRGLVVRHGAYLPEILPALIEALERVPGEDPLLVLEALVARHPSPALVVALAERIAATRGRGEALDLLCAHLAHFADLLGLERLLALELSALPDTATALRLERALAVIRHLAARQPAYQCDHCGFQARALHWQCPSCKRWGSVVPVQPEPLVIDAGLEGPRLAQTPTHNPNP